MKFCARLVFTLSLLTVFTFFAHETFAAVLSISSSGSGVYILQGIGLSNAAILEATITYDASTLSNPRVSQGTLISGALMAVNANSPGFIRLAAASVKPISGTGPVAIVTFTQTTGSAGKVLSLSARLRNGDGAALAVQTVVSNPVVSGSDTDSDSGSSDNSDSSSETSGTQYNGSSASNPATVSEKDDTGAPVAQEDQSLSDPAGSATERNRDGEAETEEKKEARDDSTDYDLSGYKSVLQRFSEFRGRKNEKSLTALFYAPVAQGVTQEPPVVLSDGKSKVKLFVKIEPGGKSAPNFAIRKGKLVSLNKKDNFWIFEVLPEAKTCETTLTFIKDGSKRDIQLSVAPRVDLGGFLRGKAGQSAFERFLFEQATGKGRPCDLNGDGKTDYVDDYIFTANYIVAVKN
jgi:hypothetical protein